MLTLQSKRFCNKVLFNLFQKYLSTTPAKYRIGLYAGSFDPPTLGHLDIIERATILCDKLYVGIGINPSKIPLFSDNQRLYLLKKSITSIKHDIEPVKIEGLVTNFCHTHNINFLVRGIRSHSDYDSEILMAIMNRKLSGIETVMLMASEGKVHISSTMVRTLGIYKKRLDNFLPPVIEDEVYDHLFKTLNN